MRIRQLTLRRLSLPLIHPYVLSYRTFAVFEPILVEINDGDGRVGWGEGHISPGSSRETREGGWDFCREFGARIVGKSTDEAKVIVSGSADTSMVAATALLTAIEMLEGHPLLAVRQEIRVPLLTPLNNETPEAIETEVDRQLLAGFRTFKIKVGKDHVADLKRVQDAQRAIAGRATIRIDANRAYAEGDACRFAAALDPSGIELFEQPCSAEDWVANANVAKASTVPLMLDEPICTPGDIERAAKILNIGFCKLKLKRFGDLGSLKDALDKVRELGMEPVLGDGLSTELGCWMEACVASVTIRNAGEFNGFLKPKTRLFVEPLQVAEGILVIPQGFVPRIDSDLLAAHEIVQVRFT
jgi:L-alanine-DL-glutamate epimerase-like enolase superfamily enzyme